MKFLMSFSRLISAGLIGLLLSVGVFTARPAAEAATNCGSPPPVSADVQLSPTQLRSVQQQTNVAFQSVCRQATDRPTVETFIIGADNDLRFAGKTIANLTAQNGDPVIAIKRSVALRLSQHQAALEQAIRQTVPGTGDEDVEEGAPADGNGAAPSAAGTGCVGVPGRLIPSNPENCTVGDIVALITEVVLPFFLNIAGGIAIIMILWGAFQYFTAYGDPQKIDAGKKTLTWAIIGLVVIIAARAIITYSCEFFAEDKNICSVEVRQ